MLWPDFVHLLITSGLVVLIWIIQIVHYPSFVFYEQKNFVEAMADHQRGISFIVIPLMFAEVFFVCLDMYTQDGKVFSLLNLILVVAVWLSTFFLQVPIHNKLLIGKSLELIHQLVRTNWIRTGLWSVKLGFLITEAYL